MKGPEETNLRFHSVEFLNCSLGFYPNISYEIFFCFLTETAFVLLLYYYIMLFCFVVTQSLTIFLLFDLIWFYCKFFLFLSNKDSLHSINILLVELSASLPTQYNWMVCSLLVSSSKAKADTTWTLITTTVPLQRLKLGLFVNTARLKIVYISMMIWIS